jgi:hypothetical protein
MGSTTNVDYNTRWTCPEQRPIATNLRHHVKSSYKYFSIGLLGQQVILKFTLHINDNVLLALILILLLLMLLIIRLWRLRNTILSLQNWILLLLLYVTNDWLLNLGFHFKSMLSNLFPLSTSSSIVEILIVVLLLPSNGFDYVILKNLLLLLLTGTGIVLFIVCSRRTCPTMKF